MSFSLDERLAADTEPVIDLALCRVLLARDANYPWLILVPRRADTIEIIDLDPDDRSRLMDEITTVCRALQALTGCDKLNVAALGNMVPQLHVHLVARFRTDAAWPGPIWGVAPAKAYDPQAFEVLREKLRTALEAPAATDD